VTDVAAAEAAVSRLIVERNESNFLISWNLHSTNITNIALVWCASRSSLHGCEVFVIGSFYLHVQLYSSHGHRHMCIFVYFLYLFPLLSLCLPSASLDCFRKHLKTFLFVLPLAISHQSHSVFGLS